MKFPELTVSGTHYEMGFQIGQQYRDEIKDTVAHYMDTTNVEGALAHTEAFIPLINKYYSPYMEEIKGISEGAGITENEALLLHVRWEILDLEKKLKETQGCTNYGIGSAVTSDGQIYAGINHDTSEWSLNKMILLRMRPNIGPKILMLAYPGSIALDGMNEYGVCMAGNSIISEHHHLGIPHALLKRLLLAQKSVEDCIQMTKGLIKDQAIGFTVNFTVCDATGDFACLEIVDGKLDVIKPSEQAGYIVHTNHLLTDKEELRCLQGDIGKMSNSEGRFNRFHSLVEKRRGNIDLEYMKTILTDHETHPEGICNHLSEKYLTAFSIICMPKNKQMHVSRGNPCINGYQQYDI
jgi:isopenicillin-N N-acyltransferase-like protein